MRTSISLLVLSLMISLSLRAAIKNDTVFVEKKITLQTKTGDVFGTLTTPQKFSKIPVVLIIAGSGPTDRNGNQPGIQNDSYKKLSEQLLKNGIATLRYDKRGIAESSAACKNEIDIRFEDFIDDAKGLIQMLKQDKRFSKVIVIGHSEGSLIGMIAATNADQFVSIAGVGQSADKLIITQLSAQSKPLADEAKPSLDSLKNGFLVKKYNPILNSIFKPSIQPYLISWIKYDPQLEIKKLTIPVLILQGTNDFQVSVDDAKLLQNADPKAHMVLINNMNHVFRIVEGDNKASYATYFNSTLPIANKLVESITDFILKN